MCQTFVLLVNNGLRCQLKNFAIFRLHNLLFIAGGYDAYWTKDMEKEQIE